MAMAAMPSPRPVRPSPSVVVAERLTGPPIASLSSCWACSRRGPIFGRLPMTWTATLPIDPAVLAQASCGLDQEVDARGA